MISDDQSRIHKVYVDDLKLKEGTREYYRRNTIDKLPDDHAGHIIADLFGGSGNYDNLVSMKKDVNLKSYRNLEKRWATLLKNNQKVKLEITCNYEGGNARPISFEISYWIDGLPNEIYTIIQNQ
jgi:DNA/RNA non-specific endonuclease